MSRVAVRYGERYGETGTPAARPLGHADIRLLSELASGVTEVVAARRLEMSSRTLRRRLRRICANLDVETPIQAMVWAARRGLL